jgi:hypothetical protein
MACFFFPPLFSINSYLINNFTRLITTEHILFVFFFIHKKFMYSFSHLGIVGFLSEPMLIFLFQRLPDRLYYAHTHTESALSSVRQYSIEDIFIPRL